MTLCSYCNKRIWLFSIRTYDKPNPNPKVDKPVLTEHFSCHKKHFGLKKTVFDDLIKTLVYLGAFGVVISLFFWFLGSLIK